MGFPMELAREAHFVRYCKPSQCSEDGNALASAFDLRPAVERGLSGDHFEFFSADHYQNIVKAMYQRHFTPEGKRGGARESGGVKRR
jgi:hypothetical protein